MPNIIIAIDGHSSTGKSSFAKIIAGRFGLIYVDTGALYRGVTLFAIRNFFIDKNNKIDRISLEKALSKLDLQFRPTGQDRASQLYMNDELVENEIRSLEVSEKVSFIASLPIVRDYVDTILAKLGEKRGVVMDGRDIGTVVFPDAELKIFMTADAEVRAARRFNEMKAKGENPLFEDVLRNVKERDFLDENRDTAPLKRAPDAILLDNSKMTIEDQIVWFDNIISKRWN
ncbi:MAG: (d)CMP kinase [Bacteroidales bacterium]|nr:(d)CMP kinase [Bacteroidales bacterium]MDD4491105.1 (d)CMP kinase [Bacteroidales bacterium]